MLQLLDIILQNFPYNSVDPTKILENLLGIHHQVILFLRYFLITPIHTQDTRIKILQILQNRQDAGFIPFHRYQRDTIMGEDNIVRVANFSA